MIDIRESKDTNKKRRSNMCARRLEPFEYKRREEFPAKLVEWIGDMLYDVLPESGYEIRDEQIFTAFQIAEAMCKKKVHLAEAGLGTGKTFAYLLSAIPYARYSKKPVVIACATSALQEQLAAKEGDIQTLSRLLGLEVDARMAKDPHQYVCDAKVEENSDEIGELCGEFKDWYAKTVRGERSEMPTIPDRIWRLIGWEESRDCNLCINRGYCKLVKAKAYWKEALDLIVVDHATYFHDLWTRQDRIADGKQPILPNYAGVIFDEGHKIMLPAMLQAGQYIRQEEIQDMLDSIQEVQGIRESMVAMAYAIEQSMELFFDRLENSLIQIGSSTRRMITMNSSLLQAAAAFKKSLDSLLLEFQIEQELYFDLIPQSLIQAYEIQMEQAIMALHRFCNDKKHDFVAWVNQSDQAFWVVPRDLGGMLNKHLYSKQIPVILTSATLSNEGDFSYFSRSIGLTNPSKSMIGSPFDIEEQVKIMIASSGEEKSDSQRVEQLVELLQKNEGRALVLVNTLKEYELLRRQLKGYSFPFTLLWEDKADRGYLVRQFKEDETSVLIGTDFWEGIDVPGEALTMVVVWELPFPKLDPLIEVQKQEAIENGFDPVTTVDYQEMGLKLKQGCGRLIRNEKDYGTIVIMDSVHSKAWEKVVMGALPTSACIGK